MPIEALGNVAAVAGGTGGSGGNGSGAAFQQAIDQAAEAGTIVMSTLVKPIIDDALADDGDD
jgi:hypothetical protein